jgi:hypothetical protein
VPRSFFKPVVRVKEKYVLSFRMTQSRVPCRSQFPINMVSYDPDLSVCFICACKQVICPVC